jgi:hypothetical protein
MGLLGPDAASITYKTPDGKVKTEPTVGDDGAYLLVFIESTKTCALYSSDRFGSEGPCPSEQEGGSVSPDAIGAIKTVTYRDGHVCSLHDQAGSPPTCPPVGFVAFQQKPLTAADVATPIKIRTVTGRSFCNPKSDPGKFALIRCRKVVPVGYQRIDLKAGGPAKAVVASLSFTAREPVTSSRSAYAFSVKYPRGCPGSGGGGEIGTGNVRRGTELRFQTYAIVSDCRGVYRGTVAYVQYTDPLTGPASPALYMLSSNIYHPKGVKILTVGHFSYRVP